jgi:hypothetical protein
MQQNDSMLNGAMNVAIVNATPNQPRNVATTHASMNVAWPSAIVA